ncbi:MAG: colanic acid/amylovoran biosynthesis glycosyltransferase [Verrucomicrobiales bacterium]|jgi:colanic acid/amylovoran biosynthesis glycosyltransferase
MSERYDLAYVFERFPTFTQTFCVREIVELERQGLRPLIFSLRDTSDEPSQSYPDGLRERVINLPANDELIAFVRQLRTEKRVPKQVDYTLRFWDQQPDKKRVYEAAWIGHKLQELAPNVKHAHGHFAGMAARTMWWLRAFHGLTFSFTVHANDAFCAEKDTLVGLDRLFRDASLIATSSGYTVDWINREHPDTTRKTRLIYNGLDVEKWLEASGGEPKGIGSRKIYSVGRLIEKKGHDDLVRASAILRDRGVEHSVHIIGDGPMEDEIRAQIAAVGLEKIVMLEGAQNMSTITEALVNEAHLFALASVPESDGGMDNLPTVLIEAGALGLPCVSTRLAGIPEVVIDGQTGLLSETRKPEAFADRLQQLLEDEVLCRKLGKGGFALAAERFDKKITAAKLIQALRTRGRVGFHPKQIPLRLANLLPAFSAKKFFGISGN